MQAEATEEFQLELDEEGLITTISCVMYAFTFGDCLVKELRDALIVFHVPFLLHFFASFLGCLFFASIF